MKAVRFALIVGFIVLLAAPAFGHRINIFALDEGGEVYTESTFAGKRPVKGGVIRVFNADGALLFTGKTDDAGICTFPRPEPGALSVEVDAGMGHKSRWELEAAAGAVTKAADAGAPGMGAPKALAQGNSVSAGFTDGDWKHLAQIVDASVAKALIRAGEETRLRDIVGGIGYIVGLLGMAAWVRSRKGTP